MSGERAEQPAPRLVVGQGLTSDAHLPRQRPSPDDSAEPVAKALGISLYAKQLVDGRDRKQLERLARYITRPHSRWNGCRSTPTDASSSS